MVTQWDINEDFIKYPIREKRKTLLACLKETKVG